MLQSAAVPAYAAAEHKGVHAGAVHEVGVIPVVKGRADDDHGAAFGYLRVSGKLPCYLDDGVAAYAGVLLLPCRRITLVVVVVTGIIPRKTLPRHAAASHLEIEYGRNRNLAFLSGLHVLYRDLSLVSLRLVKLVVVDLFNAVLEINKRQGRGDFLSGLAVEKKGVPLALALVLLRIPVAHAAVGYPWLVGLFVPHGELPLGVVLIRVSGEVACLEEASHLPAVLALGELYEVRKVGVMPCIVFKIRRLLVNEELFEYDMVHAKPEGRVRTGPERNPQVSVLGNLGVVRRAYDELRAAHPHLGYEVAVSGTGHVRVCAVHDDVAGVVPVRALAGVGLLAPYFRLCGRKVCIVVVEAKMYAADELVVARSRDVAYLRHGRDRRECDDPVRPVLLDGVYVSGGDDLGCGVPIEPPEAALAPRPLYLLAQFRVVNYAPPCVNRVRVFAPRLFPCVNKRAADVWIFDPDRAVDVP